MLNLIFTLSFARSFIKSYDVKYCKSKLAQMNSHCLECGLFFIITICRKLAKIITISTNMK